LVPTNPDPLHSTVVKREKGEKAVSCARKR